MYRNYLKVFPTVLVSVLACMVVGGAAMAQAGDGAPQVTPSQLTIAGVTGSTQTRTLLLHLPAGATVEAAVAGDLAFDPYRVPPRHEVADGRVQPSDGGRVFGTLGLRASGWDDLDNPLLAQLGVGFRGF